VNVRTAQDWDKGIRKINNSRLHPDGRRVDYTRGVTTQQPVPPALEKVLDPRFLSLAEREQIADLRAGGASMRAAAAALGRPPSTVSRELARNADPDRPERPYRPYAAHRAAADRRARPKPAKLVTRPALADYVQAGLDQRWSPEQICHALVVDHPDDREMRVCRKRSTRPSTCRPAAACAVRSPRPCAPAAPAAHPAATRPPARPGSPIR